MSDNLPDSRSRAGRGVVLVNGENFVPVYCANCGKPYGVVPESHITHVFVLCDQGCAGKFGDLAHTYADPDELFRRNATEAQLEKFGRLLTPEEVEKAIEDRDSVFAALMRDWDARRRATIK